MLANIFKKCNFISPITWRQCALRTGPWQTTRMLLATRQPDSRPPPTCRRRQRSGRGTSWRVNDRRSCQSRPASSPGSPSGCTTWRLCWCPPTQQVCGYWSSWFWYISRDARDSCEFCISISLPNFNININYQYIGQKNYIFDFKFKRVVFLFDWPHRLEIANTISNQKVHDAKLFTTGKKLFFQRIVIDVCGLLPWCS